MNAKLLALAAVLVLPVLPVVAETALTGSNTPWRAYLVLGPKVMAEGDAVRIFDGRTRKEVAFDPSGTNITRFLPLFSRLPDARWAEAGYDDAHWARYLPADLDDYTGDYGAGFAGGPNGGTWPALLCLRSRFGVSDPAAAQDVKVTVSSRLSWLAASGSAEIAAGCAAEAAKIHQYLLGQRLIVRGTPLPVIVLAHPAQSGSFLEQCRSTEDMQFILHDLHAACKAIGLKTLPQDSRSESLFLHLLVQKPPREQFAQPQARHFHRLSRIRSWLYKGGAVVLLGCLLFAGREMVGVLQSRSATSDLLLQAESDLLKYQAIQKTYPPMPVSTDGLRAVINRFESLEKRSAPVESLYHAVSRALDEAPRVLDGLLCREGAISRYSDEVDGGYPGIASSFLEIPQSPVVEGSVGRDTHHDAGSHVRVDEPGRQYRNLPAEGMRDNLVDESFSRDFSLDLHHMVLEGQFPGSLTG